MTVAFDKNGKTFDIPTEEVVEYIYDLRVGARVVARWLADSGFAKATVVEDHREGGGHLFLKFDADSRRYPQGPPTEKMFLANAKASAGPSSFIVEILQE